MTLNLLVVAFVGLFILFLIESIYFLKRKLSVGPQVANQEENQNSEKLLLIGGLAFVVLLSISLGWLFLSKQKIPSTAVTELPLTQTPTPTLSEIVYKSPTVTLKLASPTPTKIASAKVSPTKTPTPTKFPSPTPTKKVTSTPTPSKAPPIGAPDGTATVSPTLTSAVVIVPKMPVAGSITPVITFFFLALTSLFAGLIL